MRKLVWISLFAFAAAGCAGNEPDRASGGATSSTDNAVAGARTGDAQARRDNRDSRPGSREAEERR